MIILLSPYLPLFPWCEVGLDNNGLQMSRGAPAILINKTTPKRSEGAWITNSWLKYIKTNQMKTIRPCLII
jgi:hypothetical protein